MFHTQKGHQGQHSKRLLGIVETILVSFGYYFIKTYEVGARLARSDCTLRRSRISELRVLIRVFWCKGEYSHLHQQLQIDFYPYYILLISYLDLKNTPYYRKLLIFDQTADPQNFEYPSFSKQQKAFIQGVTT